MTISKVPYSQKGDLLGYVGANTYIYGNIDWRDNEVFSARLIFDHLESGRSSKVFVWKDLNGHSYPMFFSSAAKLFSQDVLRILHGGIYAEWIIVKKGTNYGVEIHEAEPVVAG